MMPGIRMIAIVAGALSASATFAGVAWAEDTSWDYSASIYLFTAETNTGIGPLETTLSFSDALDNLDFAIMGAFEGHNGTWGFIADFMYTDLGFSGETPGPVFDSADVDLKSQILSGYVVYRVSETETASVDLGAGFRWFGTSTTITPVGGPPTEPSSAEDSWVDPIIGARARIRLAEKWVGTGLVDYGGFSSDSETWQVLLSVGYEINDAWLLQGGYRYLEVNHEIDGTDFRFSQSGPIFGATYRF